MKKYLWCYAIVLIAFLIVGLAAIEDYGASADEHIQIESGHVIWRYICLKFNREVPEALKDTPDLHGFKNSYYGQAAAFPTVILEAIKGFSLDSSTILRIRHYWNFFTYFVGLTCFGLMIAHMTEDFRWAALWLLLQILLPRIFGDIFYNDRDIMLISWMMLFLSAFYLFMQHPGWFTVLLSAFTFGMAVNTRIFGLVLLIFPALFFIFSRKRKYILLFFPLALGIWFLLSPIAWEDPLHTLPAAFRHFSTQQRYLDTGNEANALFFGKYINETQLPWYYIPLYIIVTTPTATLLFALVGIYFVLRYLPLRAGSTSPESLIGIGMLTILIAAPLVGIIFHLTFYNGWRHYYFLFLPITFLSFEGIRLLFRSGNKILRGTTVLILGISFFLSASWMIQAHPYQIIYLSPIFRKQWIGKFDRDYWLLSTTENMNFLLENVPEVTINVIDKQSFIEYSIIGFPPQDRERFHTMFHSAQPIPFEYLIFNYSGMLGNEAYFDYYIPIYTITRDGIKIAEVFQRSHNNELAGADIIESVSASNNEDSVSAMIDNDYQTAWYNNNSGELVFQLNNNYQLTSLEIFPADGTAGFPNAKLFISSDGIIWTELQTAEKGPNGITFSPTETSWIKLSCDSEHQGIREILFYGTNINES